MVTLRKPAGARPQAVRGSAIISALVIAAAVAVIAGAMISRQSVATQGLDNARQRAQGEAVLHGMLAWSRQVLASDRQQEVLTRLDQPWAQALDRLPGLSIQGRFNGWIEDEQGRFNLANLVSEGRVDLDAVAAFERLCPLLKVNGRACDAIVARVIASHDRLPAQSSAPGVTFDSGRDTSSGAALRPTLAVLPMVRGLDDLRGVKGVDTASLEQLRDYVTFLPATTWVNGNTASAPVLAAQVPGLTVAKAQALLAERDHGRWFINRGDFANRLAMPMLDVQQVKVGITSDWFRVNGVVRRDGHLLRLQALLHRDELQAPRLIWERIGS